MFVKKFINISYQDFILHFHVETYCQPPCRSLRNSYLIHAYCITAIGDMELMYFVIVLMCGVIYSGENYRLLYNLC